MMRLTNGRVFERVYLCAACQRPAAEHTDADYAASAACAEADVVVRDDRRLTREICDVVIERRPTGRLLGFTAADQQPEVAVEVEVDGHPLERRYVVHSPTGYEFGYGGSGPTELALNILGEFVPPSEAWLLRCPFRDEFIVPLDRNRFRHVLPAAEVRAWITTHWSLASAGLRRPESFT